VLVVDGYPPFEMPGVQAVGPQAHPAGGPQLVVVCRVLADPAVDESVVEFVKAKPLVGWRAEAVLTAQHP